MENLLNKDSVKRVEEFIKKFNPKLEVLVLDTTARTAKALNIFISCLKLILDISLGSTNNFFIMNKW